MFRAPAYGQASPLFFVPVSACLSVYICSCICPSLTVPLSTRLCPCLLSVRLYMCPPCSSDLLCLHFVRTRVCPRSPAEVQQPGQQATALLSKNRSAGADTELIDPHGAPRRSAGCRSVAARGRCSRSGPLGTRPQLGRRSLQARHSAQRTGCIGAIICLG